MRFYWKVYILLLCLLLLAVALLTASVGAVRLSQAVELLRNQQRLYAAAAASQVEAGYHERIWPFEMLATIAGDESFVSWRVVDGDGRVVLTDKPLGELPQHEMDLLRDHSGSNEPTLVRGTHDESEAWVIPMRMRTGGRPWTFWLEFHGRSISRQMHSIVLTNLLAGLGIAVVLLPVSLAVTRKVLRPLECLSQAAKEMEKGNLDVDMPPAVGDEIGSLISAFGAMSHSIKMRDRRISEQVKALEESRDLLDQRVRQRTAELRGANEVLEHEAAERLRVQEELKRSYELLEQRVAERTAELLEANRRIRQAQAELVQAEKMSMLGQLSAGVAHEINTPTGSILNVAVDMTGRLKDLAAAQLRLAQLPPETQQWLVGILPKVTAGHQHSSEAMVRSRRRELEQQLRRCGYRKYRHMAAAIISCGLEDCLEEAARHLSDETVLGVLENLSALSFSAQICAASAQKIARIVRALRFYGRTSGQETIELDVNETLDSALVILQNRIKHIATLKLDCVPGPLYVRAVADISQVWTNILNNACDAIEETRKDGLGRIECSTRIEGNTVVVSIANTGPPIPPENVTKIFDPFFTTKAVGKGTGLGLSICAGIVKRAGGSMTVRSRPEGPVFEVSLPLACASGADKLHSAATATGS